MYNTWFSHIIIPKLITSFHHVMKKYVTMRIIISPYFHKIYVMRQANFFHTLKNHAISAYFSSTFIHLKTHRNNENTFVWMTKLTTLLADSCFRNERQ